MSRGQFSLETLFIIGISAAFMIPMMIAFNDFLASSSENIIQNQISQLGQSFLDSSNLVYNYGSGAKIVVDYSFPDHIINMSIDNNDTLVFVVQTHIGKNAMLFPLGINATGNFSTDDYIKGKKSFEFRCLEGGERVSIARKYH